MSEVKKVFSGAHIEVARNVAAVKQYCQKEETRSGELPQASDKYPSQDKLFKLFGKWVTSLPPSKNRWLYTDDGYRRSNVRGDVWLVEFDKCCEALIADGYRVESLAVNPAVRSCIKKFGNAIFERFVNERDAASEKCRAVDRQTDRQEEIISLPVYTPSNGSGRSENSTSEDEPDASSGSGEESEDYEDGDSAADERHTESSGADGSEASDGTSYTQ